jgi:tetratricopeptide (TPR) repeat protein
VLTGVGGIGKSTAALQIAKNAHDRGWQVWWVNASDSTAMTGGIIEILSRLAAPESALRALQEGAPVAIDRAWEVLDHHKDAKRCLLIFDNADAPEMLATHGSRPSDETGWIRPKGRVLQIVTTRHSDPVSWGAGMQIRLLKPLDDVSGAEALRDLAGRAEPDDGGAVSLARRLGGMPLALHLAGAYLGSSFARWRTFTDYMSALDSPKFLEAMAHLYHDLGDSRLTIAGTWDLSVDALAERGMPQARALLQLLACFAPATPISTGLLAPALLNDVLSLHQEQTTGNESREASHRERLIFQGLEGLATVGLIDIIESTQAAADGLVLMVHPVIADINRASLLTGYRAELVVIGDTAVQLVNSATEDLDPIDPSSWPDWRRLTPHLSALLIWLAPELMPEKLGELVHVCVNACDALIENGNWNEAEKLVKICAGAAARLGKDHVEAMRSRRTLAVAIAKYERYAEAERIYREILAKQITVLGQDHPDTLRTSQQMAWIIGEQGRFDEAEPQLRETFVAQARVLGKDHPDTLNTQHDLAWSIAGQHRYGEAEQLCRQVVAARERTVGPEHPHALATKANLVWMVARQGRYQEAEKMGRVLYEEKRHVLGSDNPYTLEQARQLALIILSQCRQEEAEQMLRDTLARQEKTLGVSHAKTAATRDALTARQAGSYRIPDIVG